MCPTRFKRKPKTVVLSFQSTAAICKELFEVCLNLAQEDNFDGAIEAGEKAFQKVLQKDKEGVIIRAQLVLLYLRRFDEKGDPEDILRAHDLKFPRDINSDGNLNNLEPSWLNRINAARKNKKNVVDISPEEMKKWSE